MINDKNFYKNDSIIKKNEICKTQSKINIIYDIIYNRIYQPILELKSLSNSEILWHRKVMEVDKKYNKTIFNKIKILSHKMLVIIEPRKHIHLSGVLKNFVSKIDNNWSMTIFHGFNNYNFIENIIGKNTNIKLINMNVNNLTKFEYSALLLTNTFWEGLEAKKILIFQTDCLLRLSNINSYLSYDYIGAPWLNPIKNKNDSMLYVGNGGLSLRDRDKCIYVLIKYKDQIQTYINKEDVFFSIFLKRECFNVSDYKIAVKFSSEHIYSMATGLHQSYKFRTKTELLRLLDNI